MPTFMEKNKPVKRDAFPITPVGKYVARIVSAQTNKESGQRWGLWDTANPEKDFPYMRIVVEIDGAQGEFGVKFKPTDRFGSDPAHDMDRNRIHDLCHAAGAPIKLWYPDKIDGKLYGGRPTEPHIIAWMDCIDSLVNYCIDSKKELGVVVTHNDGRRKDGEPVTYVNLRYIPADDVRGKQAVAPRAKPAAAKAKTSTRKKAPVKRKAPRKS